MTRKLLENKLVFAAIVLAFVLALGFSAAYGKASAVAPVNFSDLQSATAQDPNNPPCPWDGCRGSGSSNFSSVLIARAS